MKKILAFILALMMALALAACAGKDNDPSGDGGNSGVSQTNNKGGKYNGNYVFDPPKDNYRVVYDLGVEEARVGDKYTYIEPDGYSYNIDLNHEGVFAFWEGEWYKDSNMSFEEYSNFQDYPRIFESMENGLIHYLRVFGTEDSELGEELRDYYVGNEKVCGVDCWVFDSKGINAVYCKYWVDPSNGAVLKVDHYESGWISELTEYNINYSKMEQRLYPEDYDGVEVW